MAFGFRASGSTPIYGMQERSQREGLRAETAALDALERKRKADRIASEKPDAFRGFVSNAARIAAAYYTGGASEATGLGKKGSRAIQGRRSDGSYYDDPMGDMIEVGAGAYNMMEGMKQKDISNLKSEDIAAYNRDIGYAKSFAEGSDERKQALITARTTLEATQQGQDYGDRADTNPFLYTRGRKDVEIPTTYFEGDKAGLLGGDVDLNLKTKAEEEGQDEAAIRNSIRDLRLWREDLTAGPTPEELDKGGREQRLRARAAAIPVEYRGPSPEQLTKGYRERQQLRMPTAKVISGTDEELLTSDDQDLSPAFKRMAQEDAIKREAKIAQMDSLMDREYNKRYYDNKGISYEEELSNQAGMDINRRMGSPITPYKTYSEKEAEKMSRKDTDKLRAGTLDDIAFEIKGKALEERGGFLRGYDRLFDPKQAKEDEQHFVEYMLRQKRELAREHERTGGPYGGEWRKRKPPESALMKRKRAEKREQAELFNRLKEKIGALA